jgi:hypothetical protein
MIAGLAPKKMTLYKKTATQMNSGFLIIFPLLSNKYKLESDR